MIYLDNAATTARKPEPVVKAVDYALKNYSFNPGRGGHKGSIKAAESIYRCRNALANFFGCDNAECVIFTANCTAAVNMALCGVLTAGDHLIISNLEHNAVARTVNFLMKTGIEVSTFDATAYDVVAEIRRLIKSNTKMIFCTHASNVLGVCIDIEKIGRFCKENELLFGVDAAQTAGVIPINVKEMNIDYLCVAAHKGLYAPMATGILIAVNRIKPIIFGGTGTDSASFEQKSILPESLESGTVCVPNILGIKAGVEFVEKIGTKAIKKHEDELCTRIKNNFEKNEKIVLYNGCFNDSVPIVCFNVKNVHSNLIAQFLDEHDIAVRAGLHCAPMAHKFLGTLECGTVRVSPGIFNSKSEIDYFLKVIDRYTKKL